MKGKGWQRKEWIYVDPMCEKLVCSTRGCYTVWGDPSRFVKFKQYQLLSCIRSLLRNNILSKMWNIKG